MIITSYTFVIKKLLNNKKSSIFDRYSTNNLLTTSVKNFYYKQINSCYSRCYPTHCPPLTTFRIITVNSDEGISRYSVPGCTHFLVSDLVSLVASNLGIPSQKFYLCTRTCVLRSNLPLSSYPYTSFQLHFRLLGGSLDDSTNVSAVVPFSPRPFFLDKDNKPDTWLSLLDITFVGTKYSPSSKAQFLITSLPTELLQSLGSEVINIMKENTHCYSELCSLLRKFYLPSETTLFAEYFRTQQIGTLTPSQFLSKSRNDLQRLHPGLLANDTVVRKFFLSVLPDTTRAILAGSQFSSLDELAQVADRIGETLPTQFLP